MIEAYNFYHSQLRITIERAFGVLVHRWAILRAPLTIPLPKVAPLVECLVRLHNYCIDEKELHIGSVQSENLINLTKNVRMARASGSKDDVMVSLDTEHCPVELLNNGHHFNDAPSNRYDRSLADIVTPMDAMIDLVATKQLLRP